ncbi:hypothetical protein KGM_208682 [Danaus plexippus plexippus]|uniref:Uncharacterized protein n=1 Tax=Danaus plexippus plexippus TaxID=278856 RepID=A0A212FKV5_DANPL|nr:hypothetical protein KGM_208682 [Danaus plexippus plexippus]
MIYSVFRLLVLTILFDCNYNNANSFIQNLRRRDSIPLHEINRRNGFVFDRNYRRTKDIREDVEDRTNDDSSYRLKAALLRENEDNFETPNLRLSFEIGNHDLLAIGNK